MRRLLLVRRGMVRRVREGLGVLFDLLLRWGFGYEIGSPLPVFERVLLVGSSEFMRDCFRLLVPICFCSLSLSVHLFVFDWISHSCLVSLSLCKSNGCLHYTVSFYYNRVTIRWYAAKDTKESWLEYVYT